MLVKEHLLANIMLNSKVPSSIILNSKSIYILNLIAINLLLLLAKNVYKAKV